MSVFLSFTSAASLLCVDFGSSRHAFLMAGSLSGGAKAHLVGRHFCARPLVLVPLNVFPLLYSPLPVQIRMGIIPFRHLFLM